MIDESILTTNMPKFSEGSSVMILHERHPRTVLPWYSQALRRAIATLLQADHGDSLILSESMSLLSRRLLSAMYRRVQFSECVYTQSTVTIPRLMSCSWQEVLDLSPGSAWDGLQLYSPATSQQGDPLLKTHHKSMQWISAERHQEEFQWSTTSQEDITYSWYGVFGKWSALGRLLQEAQSASEQLLQEIVARSGDITALDWVGQSSDFDSYLPEDITSHKALPSIFSSLSEDEMQKSVACRILKCMWRAEHFRARHRLNCGRNWHRRHHNTRRCNTRHCPHTHKPEACQITPYTTGKITCCGGSSPCVHPLADARSVK
ncbi:uncharacterized protein BJ212DRAFT_1402111 [Suillus subaureus]|uniref:Uncharacterized protein n=1 Tax=Suillus subaureus TaxID=48587 RepID=A0A9P7J2S2_9AGAM|nr:uncharacterized protein BJ212DRAFT_1402111 [Suillus subaureus]KAG1799522.1 hypothetical protein BJ212DRAFT_1402111 [Suillus subaureus]